MEGGKRREEEEREGEKWEEERGGERKVVRRQTLGSAGKRSFMKIYIFSEERKVNIYSRGTVVEGQKGKSVDFINLK